jgi:hypothetical protein
MTNAAIVVGCLASLLNLFDLIFTEKQKTQFQSKLETVTLWLDYERPLQWFSSGKKPSFVLLFLLSAVMIALGCLDIGLSTVSAKIGLFLWLLGFLFLLSGLVYRIPRFDESLSLVVRDGAFGGVVKRSALVVFFGTIYVILINSLDSTWLGVALLLPSLLLLKKYWSFPAVAYGLLPMGLFVIWLCFLLLAAEALLIVCRATSWRIVQYSRGGFAAVIALATAAVALCKVYYKI